MFVALVVVREGERYLLVEEHTGSWSIPGGRAESGELLADAAIRECREESGVDVALESIFRFEQTPLGHSVRVRAFFLARRVGGVVKTQSDEHSRLAAWFTRDEIGNLEIRYPGYRDIRSRNPSRRSPRTTRARWCSRRSFPRA